MFQDEVKKTVIGELSMEMIVTIFKSLGVDQTVFVQFILLIFFFAIISNLLFKRVKIVLDLREERTTKLEGNAHAIYKEAEDLTAQYKAKIEKTHQDSQSKSNSQKNEILAEEKSKIKKLEDQLAAEYESRKNDLLKEFNSLKEKSLAEVDSLSKNLVDKLTK